MQPHVAKLNKLLSYVGLRIVHYYNEVGDLIGITLSAGRPSAMRTSPTAKLYPLFGIRFGNAPARLGPCRPLGAP